MQGALSGKMRTRIQFTRTAINTLAERAEDQGSSIFNKAKSEELERQIKSLERNVVELKEELREADEKNRDLKAKLRTFEERIGSLSIYFEEDKKKDKRKEDSGSGDKTESPRVGGGKDRLSRTLDKYLGAFRLYDEKIDHHVQALRGLLVKRDDIEREAMAEANDGMLMFGKEVDTRVKKRGPRIIENIQVVPPRRPPEMTLVSEATSATPRESDSQWSEAGRRRRTGQTKKAMASSSPRSGVPGSVGRTPGSRGPPRTRRAPPAVVSIKLEDNNSTYADILKKAREKIDIKELGINNPKFRKSANGGILLELSGSDGHAEILADRLRKEVGNQAKITRPIKLGELRISGIDYSVSPTELVGVLAASGKCDPAMIKIGPFRESSRGVQTVWAQCPLTAAVKLAELQRIEAGWSAVRVELLQARPTQCYKCWEYGHLRSNCRVSVDRQGSCFGCGSREHSVKDCGAPPCCLVCKDKGLSCSHRLGSARCESFVSRMRRTGKRGIMEVKVADNGR